MIVNSKNTKMFFNKVMKCFFNVIEKIVLTMFYFILIRFGLAVYSIGVVQL